MSHPLPAKGGPSEHHPELSLLGVVLAPAVAVMNRLTYPWKFALISGLFVLPLALVLYLLLPEIRREVHFTTRELQGTAYLVRLRDLREHLAQACVLARTAVRSPPARPDLIRKHAVIDGDFQALADTDRELGPSLDTTWRFGVLETNWRALRKGQESGLDPANSVALHTELLEEVRELASHVGDSSNLILDPVLPTYYLTTAVLLELPAAVDLLTEGRLLIAELEPGRPLTAEERARFITLAGLLKTNLERTRKSLEVALRRDPGQGPRLALEKPVREYLDFLAAVPAALKKEAIDPSVCETALTHALAANSALLALVGVSSVAGVQSLLRHRVTHADAVADHAEGARHLPGSWPRRLAEARRIAQAAATLARLVWRGVVSASLPGRLERRGDDAQSLRPLQPGGSAPGMLGHQEAVLAAFLVVAVPAANDRLAWLALLRRRHDHRRVAWLSLALGVGGSQLAEGEHADAVDEQLHADRVLGPVDQPDRVGLLAADVHERQAVLPGRCRRLALH